MIKPVTDTAKLTEWDVFTANVAKSTPIDKEEAPAAQLERIALLEADPEKWFQYYFPMFSFAEPTDFHKAATQRILNNPEWYEVRMWSRELAKSTRTMFEVLYLTLVGQGPATVGGGVKATNEKYGSFYKNNKARNRKAEERKAKSKNRKAEILKAHQAAKKRDADKKTQEVATAIIKAAVTRKNVLMISNSLANATRLLDPYRANLEANQRIKQDYGVQQTHGSWTAAEFVTRNGVSFRAVGAGQSPRGTRNRETRPDIILFDDVDTDEECRNPEIIKKKWNWIEQAVMPTRSISKNTTILFCGNRIAPDCCIERATKYADYTDEVNIRDDEGHSTWPQKNTEAHIDRVLSKISYFAIQKEYYNDPISEGSVFKSMAYKPARQMREYVDLVCYTDPSYKENKRNDYKATVLVGKWGEEFHVIKACVFQGTTAQMIAVHYDIMDIVGECACHYFMEEVFLQDMFMKEFSKAGRDRNRVIPIKGDQRKKPDKFTRIEALLEPLNRNGQLFLNENEKDSQGMKTLHEQFMALAPGSRAHDDGPDAVEGAIWLINRKYEKDKTPKGTIHVIKHVRPESKSF